MFFWRDRVLRVKFYRLFVLEGLGVGVMWFLGILGGFRWLVGMFGEILVLIVECRFFILYIGKFGGVVRRV